MPFRRVFNDFICLSVIVATLTVIIVFGAASADGYIQVSEERRALFEDQAKKSLVSLEAQAIRLFDYGDGLLKAVRHIYQRDGAAPVGQFLGDVVAQHAERFQGAVTIADADGVPRFHSSGTIPSGTNLAGRDYFISLHNQPGDRLYVGPTDYGAITHQWWFRLVRPLRKNDVFDGVVIMTMRPEHLTELYQNLSLGAHSTAAMMTLGSHKLVARLPAPPLAAYAKSMGDLPVWAKLAASGAGSYRTVDDIDGLARTYVFKRLDDYGVVIQVGFAEVDLEEGLALPRANAIRNVTLFTIVSLTLSILLLTMRVKSLELADRDQQLSQLAEQRGERLAASEARFKGLVDQSLTGIYIIEDGRFSYVNPAFCRIFGYDAAEEILALDPIELVLPEDRPTVGDITARHAKGELLETRFAFRGIRKDGDQVFVEVHGNSIEREPGGSRIIVGALLDVTENRKVEAEIKALNQDLNRRVELGVAQQRATAARLTMVMETAAEGIVGIDDESRVVFINHAACELLGLEEPGHMLGSPMSLLLHHKLADGSDCDDGNCLINKTLCDGQVRRVSDEYFSGPANMPLPVEYAVSPLLVEGETVGAVIAFHDVSDRREAQEQIAHLLAYQRAILENTPVGIAIINMNREILQANSAFCRIYGRIEQEIIGQHAAVLYRDAMQCEDIGARAYPLIITGKTFREEVLMRRGDGSDIWVNIEGHLVDPLQPSLGVVWAVTDVTSRKALDLELRRSNEELERFAYVASHDLRQPLRMVSSYLSLLGRAMKGRLNEEEEQFMGFAVEGAKRMDRMIVDLLDYSRIGRIVNEKGPVKLSAVLSNVAASLSGAVADCGGQLIVAEALPELPGYETELERLFLNLIGNALKFRVEGRPPEVRVDCRERADSWVVSVSDNGIGIPADQQQRLFQIFQRLVTREQYEGTGIGLASCRKIAEHHGGRIWVESEPGQGSTFFVQLPK